MFSKTLNYLVQHLTNKHKIYLVQKCMILRDFDDIDFLLNYIGLKLLNYVKTWYIFSVFCFVC